MAAKCKRYYWLKLKQDFFSDPRIKKLRRIAGGDTYTVILLKLMLLTVKSDGVLIYEGIENTLALELALKMDEDDKNVEATLIYMQSMNLLQELDPQTFDIPQVRELTGSESESASRVRKYRKKKELESLHCNALVTSSNETVTTEIETEKEIELEIDTEIESDPLFEKWLDEYSSGKKTPPAYKAMMRKRVLEGNMDARNTFLEWKRSYLEKLQKEENEKRINIYDYMQLVGMKLGDKKIERVVDIGSHLHLFFEDGTDGYNYTKKDLYAWIHQKQ